MIRHTLFAVLISLICSGITAQTTDTLRLQDGTVLYGVFKSLEKDKLKFDIRDAGELAVKTKNIFYLHPTFKKFRVEKINGELFYGHVSAPDSGIIVVSDSATSVRIKLDDILSILKFNNRFLYPDKNFISLGADYSRSNQMFSLNVDAGLQFKTEQFIINTAATTSIDHFNGIVYRNRDNLMLDIFKPLTPKWQVGTRLLYQRNRDLDLEARYLTAIGAKYYFLQQKKIRLYMISGLVLQTERFTAPDSRQTLREIPFLVNMEWGKPGNKDFSLNTTQTVYVSTEENRIRHDGEIRLSRKITDDFSVNVFIYDSYDSGTHVQSPINHLDYGYTLGIKYSF